MSAQAVVVASSLEWMWASEVQKRFMQRAQPAVNGVDYSARCRQTHAVGGDFCDFLPLGQECLAIAVGDASGKGLPGALMVSNLQSSVRTASFFADSDLTITLRRRRLLRYVNAGHQPPLIVRRDNSTISLETGGVPVGMFPAWKYEAGVCELHEGEVLVAYTDGLIEATNPDGEEWGIIRLQKALAESRSQTSGEIVDRIFSAVDEYTRGLQTDDATAVALQVV